MPIISLKGTSALKENVFQNAIYISTQINEYFTDGQSGDKKTLNCNLEYLSLICRPSHWRYVPLLYLSVKCLIHFNVF